MTCSQISEVLIPLLMLLILTVFALLIIAIDQRERLKKKAPN